MKHSVGPLVSCIHLAVVSPVVEKVITKTKIREVNKGKKKKKQYKDQKKKYSANQLSLCQV